MRGSQAFVWIDPLGRRPPRWEEVLFWSAWRSHHQAVARRFHYKRRGVLLA